MLSSCDHRRVAIIGDHLRAGPTRPVTLRTPDDIEHYGSRERLRGYYEAFGKAGVEWSGVTAIMEALAIIIAANANRAIGSAQRAGRAAGTAPAAAEQTSPPGHRGRPASPRRRRRALRHPAHPAGHPLNRHPDQGGRTRKGTAALVMDGGLAGRGDVGAEITVVSARTGLSLWVGGRSAVRRAYR